MTNHSFLIRLCLWNRKIRSINNDEHQVNSINLWVRSGCMGPMKRYKRNMAKRIAIRGEGREGRRTGVVETMLQRLAAIFIAVSPTAFWNELERSIVEYKSATHRPCRVCRWPRCRREMTEWGGRVRCMCASVRFYTLGGGAEIG
jgi:hypothetical protein